MKKLLLLMMMLSVTTSGFAVEVEINGLWYEVISKLKKAKVIQYKDDNKYSGSIVVPETVEYEGVTYNVTSIGWRAFYHCSGLTSITIPRNVVEIETEAFSVCNGLISVYISDLIAWCKISFANQDSNPVYYAHRLFLNGEELKDLVIPDEVTTIENYSFTGCSRLNSIYIPNGVNSIGDVAFFGCSNLTSIIIPSSVKSIGAQSFSGCENLKSVHITDLESWCNTYFGDNPLKYAQKLLLNGDEVTKLVIPESVTSISASAFTNYKGLVSVEIPNSVTTIGSQAFQGCSGLTSIRVPNSVNIIEFWAFANCGGLANITLGNGITIIYEGAFANCPEITDVYCYAINLPSILQAVTNKPCTNAFEGSYIEYSTLHIPGSSVDAYKSTEPWSSFGTIKAIEHESPGNENGDGYWSTYYNSMGNFEADDNTKVYTASLDELQEKLVLTEVTDKIIKAGQGVILKSTSANANLAYTSAEGTEGFYTNNALKGFDEATTTTAVEGTIYVLGENSSKELGFYKYSGTTLNAHKAYLEINASSARQFYSIDDNTTDISRIMNAPKTTEQIFNLQGQQVAHPSKGAYIVNGHKVIIK